MAVFTHRVYVTNDGRFVGEGDPDAAFLKYAPGTELGDVLVERWGLEQWVRMGPRTPSMVMNPRGEIHAFPRVATIPAGHATASLPGVPAEVAPPVVTVVEVASSNPPAVVAAERQQSNRHAGKPARSREV